VSEDTSVSAAASAQEQRRWIVAEGACLVRDEDRYRQRFAPYGDRLHRPVTGKPYALDYADQFSLHHWAELNLLILGLNSAWQIDHFHRDRAGIHPEAISNALNGLRARPDWADWLKIAVWHHPLASDEPSHINDHKFLERLAAAGTFGAPSRDWVPGYPLQYQPLRLDPGRVTVEIRRREEPNGAWKPDARWRQGPGKDPVPRYVVSL
jgi:hypothetical protein